MYEKIGPDDRAKRAGAETAGEPLLSGVRAVIFDLDGVLTDTAATHERAWRVTFDELLQSRADGGARPFSTSDYRRYVDGRPRYDGVAAFLASRGIELPYGDPADPPERDTVCGVGNRKNRYFGQLLEREGVDRIEPSIAWARQARERGIALAVVTSSRNSRRVLEAAGLDDLFETRVDGETGADLGLPGKPDPAYFLEAARRLGVDPAESAVVEDAESGVEAGRRGGFRVVVGIAGDEDRARLERAGADIVVADLSHIPLPVRPGSEPSGSSGWRERAR